MPHHRHKRFPVSLDFTSSSSGSELDYMQTKRQISREKVDLWLKNDTKRIWEPPGKPHEPFDVDDAKGERESKKEPGVYDLEVSSVGKKVQCLLSFGEYSIFSKWKVLAEGDFVPFNSKSASESDQEHEKRLSRKRRKASLRDIRTIAITSNWLLLCKLYRTYKIEKDQVVPAGVSLELHSLIPLRYIRLCASKPKARVIGIANQHGVLKEYQMLDAARENEDPFVTWRCVIDRLRPKLSDDALQRTIDTFTKWQRQHACRITIYPGVRKEERISLSDRNSRPSPPEKSGRKDFKSPPRKASPSRKSSRKSPKAHHKNSPKYQTGVEAIIGDSVPLSPSSDSQSEVEGVETAFGPSRKMSEVLESHYTAGSTSAAYSASADSPIPIKMPAPSAGRRRKSLKAFFRVGLFAAKAKRKTNSCDDSISSEVASPPPANRRLVQRRVSRLEMNEPIEDIFSEVTFKTMEKRSSTSDDDQRDDLSDCDIIEDPDVILKSYMEGELSDDEDVETYVFKGTEDEVSHDSNDIIDPKESELLLATPDCTRTDSTDDPLTSETDLR